VLIVRGTRTRTKRPAVAPLAALWAALLIVFSLVVPVLAGGEGPTKLFDPSVSPTSGLPTTTIHFAVSYRNREGSAADHVNVIVDGTAHRMTGSGTSWKQGVRHTWSTTLSVGTHTISFEAADTRRFTDTIDGGSVTITAPPPPSPSPVTTPKPTPKPKPTPAPTPTPRTEPTPTPATTPRPTPSPKPTPTPAGGDSVGTPTPTPEPAGGTGGSTGSGGTGSGGTGSGGTGGSDGTASGGAGGPTPGGPYGPTAGGAGGSTGGAGSGGTDGSGGTGGTSAGSPADRPGVDGGGSMAGGTSGLGGSVSGTSGGPTDPSVDGPSGGGTSVLTGGAGWGSLASALEILGIDEPPSIGALPMLVGLSGGMAMAFAFAIFGKKRRDEEPPAPDEVLHANAARGVGAVPKGDVAAGVRGPAVPAPVDAESAMPRWRRPSLLEARKADPARYVASSQHQSFDSGAVAADNSHERRIIRYRVVRLLDAPDELRSAEIGQLDQGDEVQLLERSGSYWLVLCPNGSQGWLHKMTLGEIVTDAAVATPWGPDVDSDVLSAFLKARARA